MRCASGSEPCTVLGQSLTFDTALMRAVPRLLMALLAEGLHASGVVHAVGNPVEAVFLLFAVDAGFGSALSDDLRESHFLDLRFLDFLCASCVSGGWFADFLSKSGCPAWIRTMTKASKGPCATVTPPDTPLGTVAGQCSGAKEKTGAIRALECNPRCRGHAAGLPKKARRCGLGCTAAEATFVRREEASTANQLSLIGVQPSPLTKERAKAAAPQHAVRRRAGQQDPLAGLRLGTPVKRRTNHSRFTRFP